MTRRRFAFGLGVLAVCGLVAGIGASSATPDVTAGDQQSRVLSVPTQRIERTESFNLTRTFTGVITARRSTDLAFERSDSVIEVMVDQGHAVTAGQPLARLDTRQLEIQKQQLAARRDEASALLAELTAGPRKETIEAARARTESLRSQLELRRREFDRVSELMRQNATSKQRSDEAELGLRTASAELAVAQSQLNELEAGTRSERLAAQRAVVDQLAAQLADLDIRISKSTLRSPFDGVVVRRSIDEGTTAAPAQPIVRIVESGELEAEIGLPAQIVNNLRNDRIYDVTVEHRKWPARFATALPEVDMQTRTRVVIFRLDSDAAGSVVPGQVARVSLEQTESTDGFWVPTTALTRGFRGLWAAYVVEPDAEGSGSHVGRRDVEVLHNDGERTLVRGTLEPGDLVIASGTHRVVPGQAVTSQADTNRQSVVSE